MTQYAVIVVLAAGVYLAAGPPHWFARTVAVVFLAVAATVLGMILQARYPDTDRKDPAP